MHILKGIGDGTICSSNSGGRYSWLRIKRKNCCNNIFDFDNLCPSKQKLWIHAVYSKETHCFDLFIFNLKLRYGKQKAIVLNHAPKALIIFFSKLRENFFLRAYSLLIHSKNLTLWQVLFSVFTSVSQRFAHGKWLSLDWLPLAKIRNPRSSEEYWKPSSAVFK